MTDNTYISIMPATMHAEFVRILTKIGYSEERSSKLASVFTTNSLEGVISHGANRFPRFIKSTLQGYIRHDAEPDLIHSSGSIEQWDGNLGPGPLNAEFATLRAMKLADDCSIGMTALANTNHWMRAGAYGWLAALKGYILICWTNTCPNMPAWGGKDPRLGNNPMVIAIPYRNSAIVLDFAMSQYSYGKLEVHRDAGTKLPYAGGFDSEGNLTTDPVAILNSWRILPSGYWKGSSLSLMLDILAATLSGGQSVHEVKSCASESGLSQVFIAINPRNLKNYPSIDMTIGKIIDDLHSSLPAKEGVRVRYPGEHIVTIVEEHRKSGIPVKKEVWDTIMRLPH